MHFNATQWADFCRGVVDTERRTEMLAHLVGCRRCVDWVERFERVVEVASNDSAAEPPDHAVRSVKALFSLNRPEKDSQWQRLRLHQTFDSAAYAPPAGVRSASSDTRKLTYESAPYTVELTLQAPSSADPGLIVGDLMQDSSGPIAPLATVPALLVSDKIVTGTATTNEHGAFAFEPETPGPYELWFFPRDRSMISLSLADPSGDQEPA